MPPALHDISLEAIKGQLVMVVGVVGSGKSSLIAALLGELHSRGGTIEVSYICKVLDQEPVSYHLMTSHMYIYILITYTYMIYVHFLSGSF